MRITLPVSLKLPEQISTEVQAYSQSDLECLEKMPFSNSLSSVLDGPIQIPRTQFLTYMQFRQRHTLSVEDLRSSVNSKEEQLRACLDVTDGIVHARSSIDVQRTRPESEEFGEALGLSVLDQILGTNEMDWFHLPEKNSKTFDFVASDGRYCFESECKGSFVPTTAEKSANIYQHKTGESGIDRKREVLEKQYGTSFRIGTISGISKDRTSRPTVWLLDPPVDDMDRDPQDVKLLARLEFLTAWIGTVNPKHALATALQNRLTALRNIKVVEDLNRVFLKDGRGERIDTSSNAQAGIHSRFFATKSVVTDGPTGGWVFPVLDGWLFFFGIMGELLDLAVGQDFETIRTYNRQPGVVSKTIRCVFSKGRFRDYGFNDESESIVATNPGYITVEASGDIHYSQGGLAFGWLAKPDDL